MKKLLWMIFLFCNIIPVRAGILMCMYTKFIVAARFASTPIRVVTAPFFVLDLPIEKQLYQVTLLELSKKSRLKRQSTIKTEIEFTEHLELSEKADDIRAKFNVATLYQAIQRDKLSLLEKIFTNRQQQLEKHILTVVKQLERLS